MNRRSFLERTGTLGSGLLTAPAGLALKNGLWQGTLVQIDAPSNGHHFEPLETVSARVDADGILTVFDGEGRIYQSISAGPQITFPAGGALGHHLVLLERKGKREDVAAFRVDTRTTIKDRSGAFSDLLDVLVWTMVGRNGEMRTVRINGRFYSFFVRWLRDHVHTLKGMKYFHPELRSGIDLYADFQREDGMIWDNVYERDKEKNWWDKRFRYGDFIRDVDEGRFELKRIPVENDVEYLFIEGLFETWKATGDDAWMKARLDHAMKAVTYSLTDPYRWSDRFQLLRRGFTIDTWDYQADDDARIADGDIMVVYLDRTRFGMMFGDNTGFAASCSYLAQMLEVAGRDREANQIRSLERDLRKRTDELAWNGSFFTHHIPEDPSLRRDLGVDQSTQISLSNAYSLNRGITHEQAAAIIRSYQEIRKTMPSTAPGEWYTIYPPFPRGFDGPSRPWEYMNGGVTPIVAGELAHGAFEHGFETYGVDILRRVRALAGTTDDYLHCAYRGKRAEAPQRTFRVYNLRTYANANFPGRAATYEGTWIGDPVHQQDPGIRVLEDIPFEIIDPSENQDRMALALSDTDGRIGQLALPVGDTAASIYFLHTYQGHVAGGITLVYEDGTTFSDYVDRTKFGNWWHTPEFAGNGRVICRKAWRSDNDDYVGLYAYGLDNPFPNKRIRAIGLEATRDAAHLWQIVAITLSDKPVFFDPGPVSYGIPDSWGAAAVVYALVEGLAGIVDTGVALDKALLAPRWAAAGETEADAVAKYEASGGYLAYRYRMNGAGSQLALEFTGRAEETRVEILLPEGRSAAAMTVDGHPVEPESKQVQESRYACCVIRGVGVHHVEVGLSS